MKNKVAIKITLIYFLIGFLWILFSDKLAQEMNGSAETITQIQTYKGWFYIFITSLLLFYLIRKEMNERSRIEADLIKAKDKSEEASRLKSTFLSNMSHEIRTPLNSIMGFNELILDNTFKDDDKVVFAKHIEKNGNDLLKLFNDIMDISKIQENQFTIRKTNFNLNQFLESLYTEYQQSEFRIQRPEVDFKLIKGENETEIELFTDQIRLTQVIYNLLNNAFFFTNNGVVRFGYFKLESGFKFFVEDTGCGIDYENKEMIFKPFYKGNELVIGNKGFGLGLAICKGIVSLLGGDLKFDSIPNVGSLFYFVINNQNILPSAMKNKDMRNEIFKTKVVTFDSSKINMNQN